MLQQGIPARCFAPSEIVEGFQRQYDPGVRFNTGRTEQRRCASEKSRPAASVVARRDLDKRDAHRAPGRLPDGGVSRIPPADASGLRAFSPVLDLTSASKSKAAESEGLEASDASGVVRADRYVGSGKQ